MHNQGIAILILWVIAMVSVYFYLEKPLVKVNALTGECIEVVEGNCDCNTLPETYRMYKVIP